MSTINVDLTNTEYEVSTGGWTALPAGVYRAIITKAEAKETAKGGTRIAMEFTIAGGDYDGKRHFDGFNVINANPVAEEIAHKAMKNLADSTGLSGDFLQTQGTMALLDKFVMIEVGRRKAKDERYGDSNGFENFTKSFSPPASTAAATPPPPVHAAQSNGVADPPF